MPKYTYHCDSCDGVYEIVHSLNVLHEVCQECGEAAGLSRLPTSFSFNSNKIKKEPVVGSVVKEIIEETRDELLETQKQLKKRTYDN